MGGDEVGDGFGFDLCLAAAAQAIGVVREAVLVVGADVAELVGKGLGGLGGFDVARPGCLGPCGHLAGHAALG